MGNCDVFVADFRGRGLSRSGRRGRKDRVDVGKIRDVGSRAFRSNKDLCPEDGWLKFASKSKNMTSNDQKSINGNLRRLSIILFHRPPVSSLSNYGQHELIIDDVRAFSDGVAALLAREKGEEGNEGHTHSARQHWVSITLDWTSTGFHAQKHVVTCFYRYISRSITHTFYPFLTPACTFLGRHYTFICTRTVRVRYRKV